MQRIQTQSTTRNVASLLSKFFWNSDMTNITCKCRHFRCHRGILGQRTATPGVVLEREWAPAQTDGKSLQGVQLLLIKADISDLKVHIRLTLALLEHITRLFSCSFLCHKVTSSKCGEAERLLQVAGSCVGLRRGHLGPCRAAAHQCLPEGTHSEHTALQAWHAGSAARILRQAWECRLPLSLL